MKETDYINLIDKINIVDQRIQSLDERLDYIETTLRDIRYIWMDRRPKAVQAKSDRQIVIKVLGDVFKAMAGAIDMELKAGAQKEAQR